MQEPGSRREDRDEGVPSGPGGPPHKLLVLLLAAIGLHAATIRGTVVENQTGHPLARATVSVQPIGEGSKGQAKQTNPSGIFEFTDLPAGTYRLSATKVEFVPVLYGQKRWYSPGMPIALAADDEASLTIRMPRFGAITGTLLDENDVGLPQHEVAVYTNTRPPQLLARSGTDDRGMYRLFNLGPGSYLVRSLAKTYDDESYLPTFYRDSPTVDQGHPVEVKIDEEASHVDFHAATGRLFSVAGRVSTASGLPIVTLTSDTGTETASVDTNGNFAFNPMAPGQYELLAETPTQRMRRVASFQTLTVDRDLTNVAVPLGVLPTVQFLFEDANGHAVEVPPGSLLARRKDAASEGNPLDISTDATLLPGRYEVTLKHDPSYCVLGIEPRQSDARGDGWNEILLATGSKNAVKFVLSLSPATVGGTVKNANGDAVAGVKVFVEPFDLEVRKRVAPMLEVTTDEKGRYSVGGLAPGVYRLLASFDYLTVDPAQMEAAEAPKITVEAGAHGTLDLQEFVIH
jgi:hypothetical protein